MTCSVHLTTDKAVIEAYLQRDPVYAAYALGDLEPEQIPYCTWTLAKIDERPVALALLYRRLEPPVLWTMGQAEGVAAILVSFSLPVCVYMAAEVAHLPLFQAHFDFSGDRVRQMLRMTVSRDTFRPAGLPAETLRLRRLGPADRPAIEALFAHGGPFAPDAYSPFQVADGVFYGLQTGDAALAPQDTLLAVAGTHLLAPTMGIAAVGNIYTHPAHRNQGYGQLVTSAVTAELLLKGLHVVLNVDTDNAAAVHVYEKLGYWVHCPFVEGIGQQTDDGRRSRRN